MDYSTVGSDMQKLRPCCLLQKLTQAIRTLCNRRRFDALPLQDVRRGRSFAKGGLELKKSQMRVLDGLGLEPPERQA